MASIEKRHKELLPGFKDVIGLVLVLDEEESRMVDEAVGTTVGENGLIAKGEYEVRLSDGYGQHYIYLKTPNSSQ